MHYSDHLSIFHEHFIYFVEKRWRGLMDMSDARRKSLENMIEDLKHFDDGQKQLSSWLTQKDKMANLLGPLASEPAMVDNQLQQVQLLQDEMKDQKVQYDQFLKVAMDVLEKVDSNSSEAQNVNNTLYVRN